MIYTVCQDKNTWCTYTPAKGANIYDSEEVHAFFIDLFESDGEDTIYVRHLDSYFLDIIRVIEYMGLKDVTRDAIPLKKMTDCTYSYLVSDDGRCFSIEVVMHKGEAKHIRNYECLIPIKDDNDIIKMYGKFFTGLDAICMCMFESIIDIGGIVGDGKIPLTISSLSYKTWQKSYNKYDFFNLFKDASKIEVFDGTLDDYIRPSYHGGWCFLDYEKEHIYKDMKGCTLDINSLYPYVMSTMPLPYGKPYTWKGEIPETVKRLSKEGFIYYYIRVRCKFELKKGHFPCIQIANSFLYRDWLDTSEVFGQIKEAEAPILTLTMTDYKLLLEHYEVKELEVLDGVYFRSTTKLFKSFVDTFYTMKEKAKTPGVRKIAKIILNSLSGSTAKRRKRTNLIISSQSKDIFVDSIETEVKSMSHIQIGSAITSYSRAIIIGYAHKYAKHFIYSDTDSLHLDCDYRILDAPISDKLGDFKVEQEWTEAIFFKKKIYVERLNTKSVKKATFRCAGLDADMSNMISDMLENKKATAPEGITQERYMELRARFYMGLGAFDREIPYTQKIYKNFTYTSKYCEMKLKFDKKQQKTYKIA